WSNRRRNYSRTQTASSRRTRLPPSTKLSLVPTLCVGTPFATLCVAFSRQDATRSVGTRVPTQSVGTRLSLHQELPHETRRVRARWTLASPLPARHGQARRLDRRRRDSHRVDS